MPALELDPKCISSSGRNLVGFSGGPDSLCLLQLLANSPWRASVLAIHVDHGLDDDSARRADAARQLAESLQFECRVERVVVDTAAHGGPEAAARHARYSCFEQLLEPGDHLLTAHHADDQVETVLLRLLRGAGPRGLAGMRPLRRLGPGWLGRPLLHWSRTQILEQLKAMAIDSPRRLPIDDPSNAELVPDRNYLRHRVLPVLEQRWPAVRRSLLQVANLQADATAALRFRAVGDVSALRVCAEAERARSDPLQLQAWLQLDDLRALAAIRQWCEDRGVNPPRKRMLEEFRRQCMGFKQDRAPQLDWDGVSLLAWNERIWLDATPAPMQTWSLAWSAGDDIALPDGSRLQWRGIDRSSLGANWTVTTLRTGDRLQQHPTGPRRKVTELLRELGVPPWHRERLPCLRIDGKLSAVAGLLVDAELALTLTSTGSRLLWQPAATALLSSRLGRSSGARS